MTGIRVRTMRFMFAMLFSFLSLFTFGCAAKSKVVKEQPKPVAPNVEEKVEPRTEGSLWAGETQSSSLFADTRAKRAGDIVTIKVSENSKGSKKVNTDTKRESTISDGISSFFGTSDKVFNPAVGAKSTSKFKGDGGTDRSSLLEADVTAKITEVLPNGNFVIQGRREVVVNNEEEVMVLTGVIRAEDISPANVILSSYIANARIEYTGKGDLADNQRPGWLKRIFDKVWPF